MHATSTFSVTEFNPTDYESPVATGLAVGVVHMVKEFTGEIAGRSATVFVAAFSQETSTGTYVALESFEGSIDGRGGSMNFAHSATTLGGPERHDELVVIVPGSGTGELVGITGTGALRVDDDGTHHFDFDYDLPDPA